MCLWWLMKLWVLSQRYAPNSLIHSWPTSLPLVRALFHLEHLSWGSSSVLLFRITVRSFLVDPDWHYYKCSHIQFSVSSQYVKVHWKDQPCWVYFRIPKLEHPKVVCLFAPPIIGGGCKNMAQQATSGIAPWLFRTCPYIRERFCESCHLHSILARVLSTFQLKLTCYF